MHSLPGPLVFTNGCFDLFHEGHRHLLRQTQAIARCGTLIVGVNTDASIRRLKGHDRPINPLSKRLEDLDYFLRIEVRMESFQIETFDADTPAELIQQLQPQILVKGSDARRPLPGEAIVLSLGGEIRIIERIAGLSTTELLLNRSQRV